VALVLSVCSVSQAADEHAAPSADLLGHRRHIKCRTGSAQNVGVGTTVLFLG
jgi:hypothetical protein